MSKKKEKIIQDIKVILLGDSGVGKTSLINVITGNEFSEETTCTISTTYVAKNYKINSNEYKVNLWDTAGQEKYRQITKLFYKGSDIVIFVYDIASKESFKNLKMWIQEVKDIIDTKYTYALLGNKKDLYINEQVKESEAKKLALEFHMKHKLVSAKTDPKSFDDFLQELIKDSENILKEKNKNVSLEKNNKKEKNKCNC